MPARGKDKQHPSSFIHKFLSQILFFTHFVEFVYRHNVRVGGRVPVLTRVVVRQSVVMTHVRVVVVVSPRGRRYDGMGDGPLGAPTDVAPTLL